MSRLYFHTEHDGTAELMGWEAHWVRAVPENVAMGFLPNRFSREEEVLPFLAPGHHLRTGTPYFLADLATSLCVGYDDPLVDENGRPLKSFSLILNTALAVGSDPVALMARLSAQCEIHCYVEGPNRDWMAGLIEQGRATGLYRSGAGWEDVVTLLRLRDDQPVVCSYSVTESFPNPGIANWSPPSPDNDDEEPDWDAWYDIPDAEQWAMGVAGLRREPDRGLELSPERLRYRFGHKRSFIDLFVSSPADRAVAASPA